MRTKNPNAFILFISWRKIKLDALKKICQLD